VVALFVYARPARETWMRPNPDGDRTPIKVPAALSSAIALCAIGTIVLGVLPNLVARFADLADFLG
jgi:NADH:ubiquinone oxidoreductase subunit 2 (subunit N)